MSMAKSAVSRLSFYLSEFWVSFFSSNPKYRKLQVFWLVILYAFGVYLWGVTFDWGRIPLDYFDWALINIPRIDFVRDALQMGTFPLHMLDKSSLHDISDRFFTLPDVVTTPQMILLLFLPIDRFVFIDIILHYTAGFLGLLWFYRRYNFSIYTFSWLFFLFNFNGYIYSHYTVGHFTWAAYFLFPLFFSLLIKFLEGEQGWMWVASLSFLLFYMVLAGSQHHYVWLLLFLGVLIVTCWRRAKWLIAVIISSGLLSAVRLLPPVLQLADYHKKAIFNAIYGYPSLAHLVELMIFIKLPVAYPGAYYTLNIYAENYWDFNFYIGIIGFIFLVFFGVYKWLAQPSPRWKQFILPVLILTALSIETTYKIVRMTDIPLFASERATVRIISVPVVCCLLVGAILFQEWWNKINTGYHRQMIAFMVLVFMFIDLRSNMRVWHPSGYTTIFFPGDNEH